MANSSFNSTQNAQPSPTSFSFTDFPEDVQISILSFLFPHEISAFSCTSKRFLSLCNNDKKLWFSMCHRRWGSKTHIHKWANGKISFKSLYKSLHKWENLIGFWRRSGHGPSSPTFLFFEWGSSFITGSRLSPSKEGGYGIVKIPFLWMGLSPSGEPVNFLDLDCRFESSGDFVKAATELGFSDADLIRVSVNFLGNDHFAIEESRSYATFKRSSSNGDFRWDDLAVLEDFNGGEIVCSGSPPDSVMSEIYQYFANRTSPGGDRGPRRRRQMKREKQLQGRRKWEKVLYMKIDNCSPTRSRPLQGLWKGIREDMILDFYLVAYDHIGGIDCRSLEDSPSPFSGYFPVFWTSNPIVIEPPFSIEEENLYASRIHVQPNTTDNSLSCNPCVGNKKVSRLLYISSSYDLVIPNLTSSSANPRHGEGRIWLYEDGTFGFGFLRNNFIIDLKPVALNEQLLDTVEFFRS